MSLPSLCFVKQIENAQTPTRKSQKAAGVDLYSAYDVTVPARGNALISTDLQIQFPGICYGRIAPRSGMALEHHIYVRWRVIDQDNRCNLCVFYLIIRMYHMLYLEVAALLNLSAKKFITVY